MSKYKVACILVTYNHMKYVKEALDGFFSQDYQGSIQYIISDDCSEDGTQKIINEYLEEKEISKDNLLVNFNEINLGLIEHFNKIVFELVDADILIWFTGDDVSFSNRTSKLVNIFEKNDVSLIFSNAIIIDSNGNKKGKLYITKKSIRNITEIIKHGNVGFSGATVVQKRDVYTHFGKLPSDIFNEDEQLPFRAQLLKGTYINDIPLSYYRIHEDSESAWLWKKQSFNDFYQRYVKNLDNHLSHYSEWKRLLLFSKDNYQSYANLIENIDIKINDLKKQKNNLDVVFKFKVYIQYIKNKFKFIVKSIIK